MRLRLPALGQRRKFLLAPGLVRLEVCIYIYIYIYIYIEREREREREREMDR